MSNTSNISAEVKVPRPVSREERHAQWTLMRALTHVSFEFEDEFYTNRAKAESVYLLARAILDVSSDAYTGA